MHAATLYRLRYRNTACTLLPLSQELAEQLRKLLWDKFGDFMANHAVGSWQGNIEDMPEVGPITSIMMMPAGGCHHQDAW